MANLSAFRRALHDEVLNNAPVGFGAEGYGRFDIYPSDIVTCPPGATFILRGGGWNSGWAL